ncbi:MAG: type II/IV secretion system ATPase subunit [Candidatus Aenigmarchaeota archaeon]|nr:type II/IV secretion system ATPase subunit [Candidatus Aenigmarchaeota archaeon]MDW8149163.1 type II/IV secretion system ATPase subunit [Candidatus Aenigmarchaeota archaeon]
MQEIIKIFSSFLERENIEDIIFESGKLKIYDSKRGYLETDFFLEEDEIKRIVDNLPDDIKKLSYGSYYFNNFRITVVLPPISKNISINIRKFRKVPFSFFELVENKTITKEALAYLWIFVDGLKIKPANIIIAGPPGSGKTTFLNMLTLFISREERVISIEDVYEVRILNKNWLPLLKREAISMKDIVNIVYRVRPDRLIYGEIRNREDAEVFFNFINGGFNGCFSTSFALKSFDLINRMITEPISLNPGLLKNLDLIIIMRKEGNRKYVFEISEISSFEYDKPTINNLFFHDGKELKFTGTKVSFFEKLNRYFNVSFEKIASEIEKRKKLIDYIVENRISDLNEIEKIIHY